MMLLIRYYKYAVIIKKFPYSFNTDSRSIFKFRYKVVSFVFHNFNDNIVLRNLIVFLLFTFKPRSLELYGSGMRLL